MARAVDSSVARPTSRRPRHLGSPRHARLTSRWPRSTLLGRLAQRSISAPASSRVRSRAWRAMSVIRGGERSTGVRQLNIELGAPGPGSSCGGARAASRIERIAKMLPRWIVWVRRSSGARSRASRVRRSPSSIPHTPQALRPLVGRSTPARVREARSGVRRDSAGSTEECIGGRADEDPVCRTSCRSARGSACRLPSSPTSSRVGRRMSAVPAHPKSRGTDRREKVQAEIGGGGAMRDDRARSSWKLSGGSMCPLPSTKVSKKRPGAAAAMSRRAFAVRQPRPADRRRPTSGERLVHRAMAAMRSRRSANGAAYRPGVARRTTRRPMAGNDPRWPTPPLHLPIEPGELEPGPTVA